ncbi:hypothetical protein ACGK9U_13705 [Mariniflexile sp. HNIBRBA6329]|uniref:hypothetical protein n=1 Tax=Mariniflexile sp. HNIBRBA6329 TaxID=3373088 RepID=UPI003747362F
MKFLIIEQDLKVSGTSQGIISRSFIAKLRIAYPDAIIDVVYLKQSESDDQLHLLPADTIETHVLDLKVPWLITWYNKIYWRLFHVSLYQRYRQNVYGKYIAKIDFEPYDHIFIRSAGLEHETLLGAKDLPILKKAIVTFHEPYPIFWCSGSQNELTNLELFRMKEMQKVVSQAKFGLATANLAQDMQYLYGSRTQFFALPHHYDSSVFDLSNHKHTFKKNKKITICYHGAIQFGRNICELLDVYQELVCSNELYREHTEFILRLKKRSDIDFLKDRYSNNDNIIVLGSMDFSNAAFEQINLADINIMLENGPLYCSVLLGKAPFLAAYNKPVLTISPIRSDLRTIIKEEKYIASYNNPKEIKQKLEELIQDRLESNAPVYPFGDYFSDANFKIMLDKVLKAVKD